MRIDNPQLPERFWEKVTEDPSGCWLWKASTTKDGYAAFHYGDESLAHRVAYGVLVAPIPVGLTIDHLCKVRHCVNPTHMEVVTMAENIRRGESFAGKNAAKSECAHGHPFTLDNTYITPNGRRKCRRCHVRRVAESRSRKEQR